MTLRRADDLFYLVVPKELTSNVDMIPFWLLITLQEKSMEVLWNVKKRDEMEQNQVVERVVTCLEKLTQRVNTRLLVEELKESLKCPEGLCLEGVSEELKLPKNEYQ